MNQKHRTFSPGLGARNPMANLIQTSGKTSPPVAPEEDERDKLIALQTQLLARAVERIRYLERKLANG